MPSGLCRFDLTLVIREEMVNDINGKCIILENDSDIIEGIVDNEK